MTWVRILSHGQGVLGSVGQEETNDIQQLASHMIY